MKFDELDERMRVYETATDYCVPPGVFMVARLDGRGFTRLTREVCRFEAPFDERFRDLMVATASALMECGFQVRFAYTESDEISLLFAPDEAQFGRKLRKYESILAGEASARFSLALGQAAVFDCRMSQLPNVELVVDYFRWRSEDAARNALNAHCYWALRGEGLDQTQATRRLLGLSTSAKHELLFAQGTNFNDLPCWQKRGIGVYWEEYEKEGLDARTGKSTVASRRRLKVDHELPLKEAYGDFVRRFLADCQQIGAA